MGVLNNADLHKRLLSVEKKVAKVERFERDFGSKFAYFWHNERVKLIAIVTTLNEKDGRAHLIVLWDGYSGGINQVYDSPMFIRDPLLEEHDQLKTGKWEPWLDLKEIAEDIAAEDDHDKAATADASAA